ncbi:hypothetical protein [Bosea sp. PAMC 26642]|uniref:hypothetical protein n=1 Tax=Bosea sp. (strain PAMC 26642) TaxID=1792307 RepID=UPI000770126B|nr:hypothetical protein [Bosea sp. PAMC 26642]AMJ61591.1 hypothetical protein AXW83_15905 [Bosea sp. PAMC 26642]
MVNALTLYASIPLQIPRVEQFVSRVAKEGFSKATVSLHGAWLGRVPEQQYFDESMPASEAVVFAMTAYGDSESAASLVTIHDDYRYIQPTIFEMQIDWGNVAVHARMNLIEALATANRSRDPEWLADVYGQAILPYLSMLRDGNQSPEQIAHLASRDQDVVAGHLYNNKILNHDGSLYLSAFKIKLPVDPSRITNAFMLPPGDRTPLYERQETIIQMELEEYLAKNPL